MYHVNLRIRIYDLTYYFHDGDRAGKERGNCAAIPIMVHKGYVAGAGLALAHSSLSRCIRARGMLSSQC